MKLKQKILNQGKERKQENKKETDSEHKSEVDCKLTQAEEIYFVEIPNPGVDVSAVARHVPAVQPHRTQMHKGYKIIIIQINLTSGSQNDMSGPCSIIINRSTLK